MTPIRVETLLQKQVFITGLLALTLTGCATKVPTSDADVPQRPHYIDEEISDLANQHIDEQRRLANIRQAKQLAQTQGTTAKVPTPSTAIFAGLETKRTMKCEGCDLKVAAQAIAVLLGWDANSVYELNRKPAQGVPVTINLNNEPLRRALEQIKVDAGHIMDLRIDPNFKSMVIEYKTVR